MTEEREEESKKRNEEENGTSVMETPKDGREREAENKDDYHPPLSPSSSSSSSSPSPSLPPVVSSSSPSSFSSPSPPHHSRSPSSQDLSTPLLSPSTAPSSETVVKAVSLTPPYKPSSASLTNSLFNRLHGETPPETEMGVEEAVQVVTKIVRGLQEVLKELYSGETHSLSRNELQSILYNLSPYTLVYDRKGDLCFSVLPSSPNFNFSVPISTVSTECEAIQTALSRYQSPSRLSHPNDHTMETDECDAVYTIGLILCECLTGQIVFDGYETERLKQIIPLGVKPDTSTILSPAHHLLSLISNCLSASGSSFTLQSILDEFAPV